MKKTSIKKNHVSSSFSVYKSREQSGRFHVYFRGNSRYTVFYSDNDFVGLLQRCDSVAKIHHTKIIAFVIMDNHVHLQIITDELTAFMRALLIGYSQWYNKRKGLADKLFKSPFSSSQLCSKSIIEENILYIFSNPIKAGICLKPWDYKWSSYHFHDCTRINPLEKFINIDTTYVNQSFPNKYVLDNAIQNFNLDVVKKNNLNWPRHPDNLVIKLMTTPLNGRNLFALTKEERWSLMITLRKEGGATYRQIALFTHESYDQVRKLLR